MTPEAQRIAIGEACGLTRESLGADWDKLPDYLNDLNAMHRAEKKLSLDQRHEYQEWLNRVCDREYRMAPVSWLAINSTPTQRAEAFLKTIGKWDDSK